VKVWNAAIEPAVTAHAQPVNICKGTLFVTVDSDVWKYEIIRYHRKEILKRMQYSFGLKNKKNSLSCRLNQTRHPAVTQFVTFIRLGFRA